MDPLFVLSECRIRGRYSAFIPFCTDGETLSNALTLPDEQRPHAGELLHHHRLCQFHTPTSRLLGVDHSCWQTADVSLNGPQLIVRPKADDKADEKPRARASAWQRVCSLWCKGGPPRLSWFELDHRTTLLLSRREPRLFALHLRPTDNLVVFHAQTPTEALEWVGILAGCLGHLRAAQPIIPRIPLQEITVSRDGTIRWPLHAKLGGGNGIAQVFAGFVGRRKSSLPSARTADDADDDAADDEEAFAGPTALRNPSDVSRIGRLEVLQLVDGDELLKLGLPLALLQEREGERDGDADSGIPHIAGDGADWAETAREWEVREVQIEWFGMLCGPWRSLLNSYTNSDEESHRQTSGNTHLRARANGGGLVRRVSTALSLGTSKPSSSASSIDLGGSGGGRQLTRKAPKAQRRRSSVVEIPPPEQVVDGPSHHHIIRVDFEREQCSLYANAADPRVLALRHGARDCLLLLRAATAADARSWGDDLVSCLALGRGETPARSLWHGVYQNLGKPGAAEATTTVASAAAATTASPPPRAKSKTAMFEAAATFGAVSSTSSVSMQEVLDELDAEVDAEIASAPLSAQVEEALRNPKLPAMQYMPPVAAAPAEAEGGTTTIPGVEAVRRRSVLDVVQGLERSSSFRAALPDT